MQEEGSLSSKYSPVQLAPPPKIEDAEVDDKVGDAVDTPESSPKADEKKEGVAVATTGDEVVPTTSSTVTVDSSIVEEMLGVSVKIL